jgi:hypothetical protein
MRSRAEGGCAVRVCLALLVAGLVSAAASASKPRAYRGETYTCRFPRHGLVIIDTRDPGATITYRGRRHAAEGGSYFYAAKDDSAIVVMFGPRMRWWEFGIEGERATACTRRINPR